MRGRLNGVLLFGALALLVAACAPPKDVTPAEIAPPTGLTVVAADAEVTITWIASTSEDVVGYNILQGTSASDLTLVHSSDATTLTHTLTGLTNGTEYHFAVQTEGSDGRMSARSSIVTATPGVFTTCVFGESLIGQCTFGP